MSGQLSAEPDFDIGRAIFASSNGMECPKPDVVMAISGHGGLVRVEKHKRCLAKAAALPRPLRDQVAKDFLEHSLCVSAALQEQTAISQ